MQAVILDMERETIDTLVLVRNAVRALAGGTEGGRREAVQWLREARQHFRSADLTPAERAKSAAALALLDDMARFVEHRPDHMAVAG